MPRSFVDFARDLPARLLAVGIVALVLVAGLDGQTLDRTAGTSGSGTVTLNGGRFLFPGPTAGLVQVFRRFDTDGDGWLTKRELAQVLGNRSGEPRDFDKDGKVSEAEFERSFREVYEWRPANRFLLVAGHVQEARGLMVDGYVDKALSGARTIVESFPEWSDGWALLGELLLSVGEAEQSLKACREAERLAPNNDGAWLSLSFSLAANNLSTESAQALERGLELLGIKYRMFGRDSITAADCNIEQAFCGLMIQFMHHLQRPAEALRMGDWARQLWGRKPQVEALRLTAMSMLGREAEALEAAGAGAAGTEGRFFFLDVQGRILVQLGRPREAIGRLQEALALPGPPADRRSTRLTLYSSLMSAGQTTDALRVLDQVLAEADVPGQKQLVADALMRSGNPVKAAALLEEVVAAARGVPGSWMFLAHARAAMGDRPGTVATLERALTDCKAPGFRMHAAMMLENIRQGGQLPIGPPGSNGRAGGPHRQLR